MTKRTSNTISCHALTVGTVLMVSTLTTSRAMAVDFASTDDPSAWQVSTSQGGADGQFASFSTAVFRPAVLVPGRYAGDTPWIANNSTGTNACCTQTWTFFVFQQTFDLTAAQAAHGDLQFQWAADDSGEGIAERGTWKPKYSLNGGPLTEGVWTTGYTYDLGPLVHLDSGFVSGSNKIDFYVEGNGVTDGFALKSHGFTAAVPEPETYALLFAGLGAVGFMVRRRKR